MMPTLLLGALLAAAPTLAGKDPDSRRRLPDGQQAYLGARLAVGAVAHAFVLQYPNQPAWQVSPSRYAVDFQTANFHFRNRAEHALLDAQRGRWMQVVFTVVTVAETPVESPRGSGVWTWALTYECDIQSLAPAGH